MTMTFPGYTQIFLGAFAAHIHIICIDFQKCGILTSVDSYEPVQPPLSLEIPDDVWSVA